MDKQRNSVLVVDDESINLSALTHILSSMYTVYVAKDGRSAINSAKELLPDLILLDILMPDINGFDVIQILKAADETADIPVIFATGLTSTADEEYGLTLGAVDYVHKPYNPAIVKLRVNNQMQIVNQMRMIQYLSMTDALTSTANRWHFNTRMSQEWQRSMRELTPLSILLIDIDDFKKINDTHGHLFGDVVLQNLANNIKICLKRPMDLAARWGGEEFVVLLPNTDLKGAAFVAERIRTSAEKRSHFFDGSGSVIVTVSIGINCTIPHTDFPVYDFISDTDKALYRAKKQGKNRVCAAIDGNLAG